MADASNLIKKNAFFIAELTIIVIFALVPLFVNFPYRVNIYLSWEGAYRLYLGHMPYKDFGIPMGFGYWIIPAIFFKLFGPYLLTLVKAQVFINIVGGLAFRSILKSFGIEHLRIVCILVFCISYSFFNFWPWYNHTVIIYQLVGSAFILKYIFKESYKFRWAYMLLGAFFIFMSVFTKQDGGGLAFMICLVILAYTSILEKSIKDISLFLLFFGAVTCLFVLPFLSHDIGYWFNYGQPPHYSRISIMDFLNDIFGKSPWTKFYLLFIVLITLNQIKSFKTYITNKKQIVFLLFTLGILVEALLYQVTSYVPPNNNIFFHSFAFAYILSNLEFNVNFKKSYVVIVSLLLVMLWWSGTYWKYAERIVSRVLPAKKEEVKEGVVSKNTWSKRGNSNRSNVSEWIYSDLESFKGVYMPKSTVEGMDRLFEMEIVKEKGHKLKMLNMTELTPLAHEMGFELIKSSEHPLWFHKGVSIFDKQVEQICENIKNNQYDIVLFEYLVGLNNFYPFAIRDCLKTYYKQVDTFEAPRSDGYNPIEVYVRRE